jgi:hypothetical protein
MKAVFVLALLAVLAFIAAANECTEAMQIACADDFRLAYPVCKKSAESGGKDIPAELACMKYFNKMKPECWPCICNLAKMDHIPIQGC